MLTILNLGNNTLYDTFPLWLGKLPELIVLILRANWFYGQIELVKNNFPKLDVLDIASNNFSDQLAIEFFQGPQLRSLKISDNKLEGKLPRSLANCKKLEVLDVGKNMIQDTFPFWLVKLPSLKVLVLRANRFFGTIKFSEDENVFPMLHILDLASNNFSGELSDEFFQSLKAMKMMIDSNKDKLDYIGDRYYKDSVTIVSKGFEIFYEKILTIFVSLDLSNNSFHGRIPEEMRNLKSLKVLNFSYNSFRGPIPLALGNLTNLESLDLSHNYLSGKIPLQLTSLTFLAVLNFSYNQLDGSIPQSNQFGTFSNYSYIGNPRLCGLPLTRECNEVDFGMPPSKNEDSWIEGLSDWKIVLMGYGCGLVIGLCIGYTVQNELGNKWLDSFARKWNRKRFIHSYLAGAQTEEIRQAILSQLSKVLFGLDSITGLQSPLFLFNKRNGSSSRLSISGNSIGSLFSCSQLDATKQEETFDLFGEVRRLQENDAFYAMDSTAFGYLTSPHQHPVKPFRNPTAYAWL
ncbi:hypothetical protein DITRI_Ditri15bG0050200 [Diplodiscus trichospermus]